MRGLNRVREARKFDDRHERGAVATIVATLLAGGVIIGMLAVSVDIGNLMYERRQVQNGADATSLALAAECAADESSCGPTQVQDLLGSNAHDDASRFLARPDAPNGVCGRDVDSLPTCSSVDPSTSTASLSELSECPPLPDWLAADPDIPYVETYAATDTVGNGDKLFLPFSRVLAGGASGDKGSSACARAAWGQLGSSRPSLPIVLGECNWNIATNDGSRFIQSPPYAPAPNSGAEVPALEDESGALVQPSDFVTSIFGHVNGSETEVLEDKFPCDAELPPPSGGYTSGGFGWLDTCGDDPTQEGCEGVTNPCYAPILGSGTVGGSTGAATPSDCKSALEDFVGQEVDVPVVTGSTGSGASAQFTVAGISTFFLAGYHNVPNADTSDKDAYEPKVAAYAENACVDPDSMKFYKSTCIWGWFTSPVRTAGEIDPTVPERGPVVVQPAG